MPATYTASTDAVKRPGEKQTRLPTSTRDPGKCSIPLPMGVVAVGLPQSCGGHRRYLLAGHAHDGIHPDRCLCRVPRFRPSAPVPGDASALRPLDPRLAGAWCGVAASQMGGDIDHVVIRRGAAGRHVVGRFPPLVDGGDTDRLHGDRGGLVVAASRAAVAMKPGPGCCRCPFIGIWLYSAA